MSNFKIIFLCDVSIKSGLGHFMRSLAIAESLIESGEKNILFLVEQKTDITKYFKKINFIHFNYLKTKKETFLSINQIINDENPKLLFLDTKLDFPKNFFNSLKDKSIKIATIDDNHEKRLESDISFYPPQESVYNLDWKNYKGNLNIGWDWIALRSEFFQKQKESIEINHNKKKKDVLITMGGSDPNNITLLILENLTDEIFEKYNINVVLGASNPYKLEVNKFKLKVNNKFNIIENPSCISDIMIGSYFAICTFGITAYELAALQIPAFHICLDKDHLDSSKLFVKNQMAISLGMYYFIDSKILNKFIFEEKRLDLLLKQIRHNCKKYIDTSGAKRIASKLIFICENNL